MTSETEVRPRALRLPPETRRRQIVQEASRLIAISGFNAVSLADIAEAVGIRGPSVLRYFPTMNDLLAAVLVKRDEDAYDGNAFPTDLGKPPAVRAYLQRVVEHNVESKEIVRLFVVLTAEALDPEHPAHEYFFERNRLTLIALEEMLGWLPHPSLAARELLAFWQGLELQWVTDPTTDFLAVWNAYCDRLFEDR
jgi:AcrR family transcriptional regulator